MKILYVATAYAGLDSLLFERAYRIDGLPPQTKVLRAFIERGDEVEMLIHVDGQKRPLSIACDWLKKAQSIQVIFRGDKVWDKLLFIRSMDKIVKTSLKEKEFNFVYLVGDACVNGAKYAHRAGVPCGQRLFGSYVKWMLAQHSKIWCVLFHYPRVAPFFTKKSFLLVTKDGSDFEGTLQRLGIEQPFYDAYEWTNGVCFPSKDEESLQMQDCPKTYLFCGSRLERIKGQKTCIEVLRLLHERGYQDIHLVLAGRVSEPGFDDELREDAKRYNLESKVHFLGSVPQHQVWLWAKNALATLAFNSYSNRGNATIEALAVGAVVIVPKTDIWMDDLVIDEKTGFRVEGALDAADRIERIMKNPEYSASIRQNAQEQTRKIIPSWEQRIKMELDLVDSYVFPEKRELRADFPKLR